MPKNFSFHSLENFLRARKKKNFLFLRRIASKKIPITEDAALADFLSMQEIGQAIPEETWEAVAKIFAFIVQFEAKERGA